MNACGHKIKNCASENETIKSCVYITHHASTHMYVSSYMYVCVQQLKSRIVCMTTIKHVCVEKYWVFQTLVTSMIPINMFPC